MAVIERLVVKNLKTIQSLDLVLNPDINIIVGDNEVGKSTILEAIDMALTCRLYGRYLGSELSPYMFNKDIANSYVEAVKKGDKVLPPSIMIELYFTQSSDLEVLRGNNNSLHVDECGISLKIEFDDEYTTEYTRYIEQPDEIQVIPVEYYKVVWQAFSFNNITKRGLPISSTFIDASTIRLQNGSDYYIRKIIEDNLTPKERAELSIEYRNLKEKFADKANLDKINNVLSSNPSILPNKTLSMSIDVSGKSSWETIMTSYLDEIPFSYIGQGDQSILKILLSLEKNASDTDIILIEEPENHLSFPNLYKLIKIIGDRCIDKQLIISTHSTFVLNKLGINNLILLKPGHVSRMTSLAPETLDYFMKLPGYDTLRLVIAEKTILVEGPSDELFVQRAYKQSFGKLPLEDGIDVISVRGLSFKRFLDIALMLDIKVHIVTDNDGDYKKNIEAKYEGYIGKKNVVICYDKDNSCPTLEPQIANANELQLLNRIFNKGFASKEELIEYMKSNKTECALLLFSTSETLIIPDYVVRAIRF